MQRTGRGFGPSTPSLVWLAATLIDIFILALVVRCGAGVLG